MGSRIRAMALVLAMGLTACPSGGGSAIHTEGFRPSYRSIDCPPEVGLVALVEVKCGTLTVLAHHRNSGPGKLHLFVARMLAGEHRHAPDPVLAIGGDLGVASDYVTLGAQVPALGRDVIVLDARGTGHSQPSLVCPEVDSLPHSPTEVRADDPRTRTEFLDAVRACHDRLISQEVDLTAFDLHEMAADADDLRAALGIDRWNVMALGTTSRIALEYLRDYPQHARTVVLDSPEWPGVDPYIESVEATRHAISEFVAACRADAVCLGLAPHLGVDVRKVMRELDEQPYVARYADKGTVQFDAGWFVVWLRARLAFTRPPGTYLPQTIADFARRSGKVLQLEAKRLGPDDKLCQGFLPNCWSQLVRSFGAYLSVMCRDVVPFTDRRLLPGLVAGDRAFQEAFGRSPFLDACAAWDAGRGDPVEATRVRTEVPTLAVVGRFDPFGTAPDAELGMAAFAHGYLVVAPVNGHGVTGTEQWVPHACMVRLRDAWLDDPAHEPDSSCIGSDPFDYGLPLDFRLFTP